MEEHVIGLVKDSVNKHASSPVPTVEEMLVGLGLSIKYGKLPPDKDGILAENKIAINTLIQNEERKQFTKFHEITHYLIEQDGEIISILHDANWNQEHGYDFSLERFCNIGAAEFLMPREEFRRVYSNKGFQVGTIIEASRYFGSSKIATAIQLAKVATHSCIIAVCEYGLLPADQVNQQAHLFFDGEVLPESKLHVVYAASSPSTKYQLARYTVIPEDHPIYDAYFKEMEIDEESYIPFRSGKKMPCCLEALPHSNRIYAIFHLDSLPNSSQLEFALY
jgi:Zn-dependent peptidase ImmA (M78 family)